MSANTDQPPQQPTSDAKIRGVALVTGGASGIGKACAVALANKGYQVALNYRTQTETADAVCRSLAGEGHRCYQADVTRLDELEAMVKAVQQDYGRIDVLINAAGRYTAQSLKSDSLQEWHDSWQTCMALNLHAPVNLCYLVAPAMAVLGKGELLILPRVGRFGVRLRHQPMGPPNQH
jgi:NAD(P)-dependent dehydrogenase (short-subunit alcohol dehydrogenase family)